MLASTSLSRKTQLDSEHFFTRQWLVHSCVDFWILECYHSMRFITVTSWNLAGWCHMLCANATSSSVHVLMPFPASQSRKIQTVWLATAKITWIGACWCAIDDASEDGWGIQDSDGRLRQESNDKVSILSLSCNVHLHRMSSRLRNCSRLHWCPRLAVTNMREFYRAQQQKLLQNHLASSAKKNLDYLNSPAWALFLKSGAVLWIVHWSIFWSCTSIHHACLGPRGLAVHHSCGWKFVWGCALLRCWHRHVDIKW